MCFSTISMWLKSLVETSHVVLWFVSGFLLCAEGSPNYMAIWAVDKTVGPGVLENATPRFQRKFFRQIPDNDCHNLTV